MYASYKGEYWSSIKSGLIIFTGFTVHCSNAAFLLHLILFFPFYSFVCSLSVEVLYVLLF